MLKKIAADERRLMRQVVSPISAESLPGVGTPSHWVIRIGNPADDNGVPVVEIRFKAGDDIWIVETVSGIHKDTVISMSLKNTFVHRIVNALIRFRDPAGDLLFILPYDLCTAVSRSAVDYNIFIITASLRNDAPDCFFQSVFIIPVDCDNREFHPCLQNIKLNDGKQNCFYFQRERYGVNSSATSSSLSA